MANKRTKLRNKLNKVKTKDKKIISQNTKRNMQEIVLINSNDDGTKYSATRHVPIDTKNPWRPYKSGKSEWEYKK